MSHSMRILTELRQRKFGQLQTCSFTENSYIITHYRQSQHPVLRVLEPAPAVWIIESGKLLNNQFGIAMVPYNRFKQLFEIAKSRRTFPLDELTIYLYQDSEIAEAVTDIGIFYKKQTVPTREATLASEFMLDPVANQLTA